MCIYTHLIFFLTVTGSIPITTSKQVAAICVQLQGGDVVTAPAKGELK